MSLTNFIEKLRARPEGQRRQIAFWSSLGITAIIAVAWLASVSVSLSPSRPAQTAAVSLATSTVAESAATRIISGWKIITNQQ